MGDLGRALELMHAARHLFGSVRATIAESYDGPLGRTAAERYAATLEGQQSGFADAVLSPDGDGAWQTRSGTWRLWVEKPGRVREERDDRLHGAELGIRNGELWWMYHSQYGPVSNEHDPSVGSGVGQEAELLLDPSPLLGAVRFEAQGRANVAGRTAIVLRGEVRSGAGHSPALFRLGDGVRELELAVDTERGILLRRAALLDGAPYQTTEVAEIAFEESFPPATFTFSPPRGETRRPVPLPDPWECQALHYPGDERHGSPPFVTLRFRLPDASHRLVISERAAGARDELDHYRTWEVRDYQGERLEVSPHERPMETHVRLQRDGTSITLSSDTLELEHLLRLTRSLLPPET